MTTNVYEFELALEEKRELAHAIVAILEAEGYGTRLWSKEPGRVYVTRKLSRGTQEMGYVELLRNGDRNYNGLTRATSTIRGHIEGNALLEEPLAEMKRKDEARVARAATLGDGT